MPVPRSRLLTQKALVSATLSGAAIVVLVGVSLLIGTVLYGAESLITPLGEGLPYGTALVRLLIAVAYIGINLLWVAGLAMLLSVLTDAPLGAVGGAVMTSILMQILDQITALGSLRNYLPGHYANSWIDAFGTSIDWNDMVVGSFSAITYAAVFGLIAWRRFGTKDITS